MGKLMSEKFTESSYRTYTLAYLWKSVRKSASFGFHTELGSGFEGIWRRDFFSSSHCKHVSLKNIL